MDNDRFRKMSDIQLRTTLNVWLEEIAISLNLRDKKILEVGIAGDDKPSGSYKFFGERNNWTTLDKNPIWKPDIEADICESGLADNSFDLVIMTQTLEHIWDFKKAISEIYRITKQYAIIDCPWMFAYHCDKIRKDTPTDEWDDYWRISPSAMKKLCKELGFKEVKVRMKDELTIALCQK